MTDRTRRHSSVLAAFLSALVLLLVTVDVYAAPQPKPTAKTSTQASASSQRPDSRGQTANARYVKPITANHRMMKRTKSQMLQSRRELAALDQQILLARRGEEAIKQRHAASDTSQLRNAVRAATVERANLENRRTEVLQQYRSLRSNYRQARAALNASRNTDWRARLPDKPGVSVGKARKLSINTQPLPRSGSGESRPGNQPKGILKTSTRYTAALAQKQN